MSTRVTVTTIGSGPNAGKLQRAADREAAGAVEALLCRVGFIAVVSKGVLNDSPEFRTSLSDPRNAPRTPPGSVARRRGDGLVRTQLNGPEGNKTMSNVRGGQPERGAHTLGDVPAYRSLTAAMLGRPSEILRSFPGNRAS